MKTTIAKVNHQKHNLGHFVWDIERHNFCPGFWGRRWIWRWVGPRLVFTWSSFRPNGRSRSCWGSQRRFGCRRFPSRLRFCFCSRGRIWFISFWCVTARALSWVHQRVHLLKRLLTKNYLVDVYFVVINIFSFYYLNNQW